MHQQVFDLHFLQNAERGTVPPYSFFFFFLGSFLALFFAFLRSLMEDGPDE